MKKTLTINIAGTVFHIEEDAYELLKDYLQKINQHFASEDGGMEIINDIETRIAELFKQKMGDRSTVITLQMVQSIMETMGLPHEMMNDPEETATEEENTNTNYTRRGRVYSKKLYRDPSGAILGGVCGGLAHYLKIDRIWVRLLYAIITIATFSFAPFVFILAYIVLWAALPKALTYSQRLEMQGEPVNVENIGKKAKEKPAGAAYNTNTNDPYKTNGNNTYSPNHRSSRPLVTILKVILGVFILMISLPLLIGLLVAVLAATHLFGALTSFAPDFYPDFILNNIIGGNLGNTLLISISLIIGIPVLLLLYAGVHMLFNFQSSSKGVLFPALGIWVIAIVFAIASSVGVVDNFKVKGSTTRDYQIENIEIGDTIMISINKDFFAKYSNSDLQFDDYKLLYDGSREVIAGVPKFNIKKSNSTGAYIAMVKSSRSDRLKNANDDAQLLKYNYEFGRKMTFDPYFILAENQKWRNQQVKVTLYLPEGYVVYLHRSLLPIIHDIKNVTNTWDGDMVGHYWEMKEDGLTRIAE